MNDLTTTSSNAPTPSAADIVQVNNLTTMIARAAAALSEASTPAEVLDVKHNASAAYDTAKIMERLAKAKQAHAEIITACRKAQANALEIEAQAQCRLADVYDAAQASGEAAKPGEYTRANIPNENISQTVADIGLTSKVVHEARKVRDAEKKEPGIVRKTLDEQLSKKGEVSRADIKRAVEPKPIMTAAPTTFVPRPAPVTPEPAADEDEEIDWSHNCMFCGEEKETVVNATDVTGKRAEAYGDDISMPVICDECVSACVEIVERDRPRRRFAGLEGYLESFADDPSKQCEIGVRVLLLNGVNATPAAKQNWQGVIAAVRAEIDRVAMIFEQNERKPMHKPEDAS